MSSFGNQAKDHETLVRQVFYELDHEFRSLDNARKVIKIGRQSKNVEAFNAHLSQLRILLPISRIPSILNAIHRVYPPESEAESCSAQKEEISIDVVQEDPEFLVKMTLSRKGKEASSQEQESLLDHGAKSRRALIEKHMTQLGEIQAQRALVAARAMRIEENRESFPVFKVRDEIIRGLNERDKYRVLIVIGEAGSGKMTQIPQYLVEARFALRSQIVCTLPRRDAAEAAAQRVPGERIKYMDELALCCEIMTNVKLSGFSALVINDAHERSFTTDLLLGLIKNVVFKQRTNFRLIVNLAYPDYAKRLQGYFFDCKIITVPCGPHGDNQLTIIALPHPVEDPLEKALQMVLEYRADQPHGEILLLLSCQDEVNVAVQRLSQLAEVLDVQLKVISACSSLRSEIDPRVFEEMPLEAVKVVVATSAAETVLASLDTVGCVIDLGLTERRVIDSRQAIDALAITPISKASEARRMALVKQRGGKYLQLYTETAPYCQKSSSLDIQTANLSPAVVRILYRSTIGIFEYVDPPPRQHVDMAMRQLYWLEALDAKGKLTRLGCEMPRFPLDPPWSKVLLQKGSLPCNRRALTVVAMAQVGSNFFVKGWENRAEVDQRHREFFRGEGDHMSWLAVYEAWEIEGCSSEWCDAKFVDFESLTKAKDIRNQLATVSEGEDRNDTDIPKAITSGLFFHAARKDIQEGGYRTLVGKSLVYIHPQSVLFRQRVQPDWVIYNKLEIKDDKKEYMFGVMSIDPKWLIELAPRFFRAPRE